MSGTYPPIPYARYPRSAAMRRSSCQKVATSLIAVAASAGITLRATKSSQSLNFALARASTIAFEFSTLPLGSLLSSAAVAVFRLILAATGAVPLPVVAGAVAAGAWVAGLPGLSWARAGAETRANANTLRRTRLTVMEVPLLPAVQQTRRRRDA